MTVTLLALQLEPEAMQRTRRQTPVVTVTQVKQKKELPDERLKSLVVRLENC